ncbi:MAG: hypothetical protein GX149_01505 [Acholeplasmataceae bacterium]|jgi:hypothetical protein|nr:hypothetical protein [Acholeplasmataceae bacterium]
MINTYEMIDLTIYLKPAFDKYFKNNLEAYATTKKANYFIYTHLVAELEAPLLAEERRTEKRRFYRDKNFDYVMFVNEKELPLIIIKRRKDYQEYHVYLDQNRQKALPGIEYTIYQMIFMEIALERAFLPLHASAFVYKNKAILVSGPSGTGKSTLSRRMNRLYELIILNDDKPLLRLEGDKIMVYSSPFSGKEALNNNLVCPLGKIVFIAQGKENKFSKLSSKEAINELLKNMFRPESKEIWEVATIAANKIIKEDLLIQYDCLNEDSAAEQLKKYLDGEKL